MSPARWGELAPPELVPIPWEVLLLFEDDDFGPLELVALGFMRPGGATAPLFRSTWETAEHLETVAALLQERGHAYTGGLCMGASRRMCVELQRPGVSE